MTTIAHDSLAVAGVASRVVAALRPETGVLGYSELWEVPGSGHMKGIEAQPAEYERRVAGFFDKVLLGARGGR